MTVYDFSRTGATRQQMASSPATHSIISHRRRGRPRAALGSIGTLLVLMGVGIGVLTIRFVFVLAHTVLQ